MTLKNLALRFKNKSLTNIFLTAIVFLLSIIPLLWLKDNQILLGYDNVYPLNAIDFLKDRFFSWTQTQGFGFDQSGQQGTLVIHFVDSIPQFFGASPQLSQKIVFSFWFFLIILSSYVFVLRLENCGFIKSKYLRYIFPVLYSMNFYILQAWWVAERAKFSLVVATPLILAIIFPMVKDKLSFSKILRSSILCSLVLAVFNGGGWGGLSLYGGLLIVLFCFFVFYTFVFLLSNRKKDIVHLILFNILLAGFFAFLNAYTFLPFISTVFTQFSSLVTAEGGFEGIVSWTRYLSGNTSFINLLRLQGIPDWYDNATHPYSLAYFRNPLLILSSFVFPTLLFASFISRIKENMLMRLFLLFLLLVSLFLSAGAHDPLGFVYELLMQHVPGFVIFRSPIFKFGYAYFLAASFLIGIALSSIIEYVVIKTQKYKMGYLVGLLLPLLILVSIIAYHFPYITGNIFNIEKTSISSRLEVPAYVYDFSKWWMDKGNKDRILLLPNTNDNWYFDQFRWNYMSLFPLLGNFANENVITNSFIISPAEKSLLSSFYSSINQQDYRRMDSLASMLGIRYFLIRKDFYYDLPDQETDDPAQIEPKLNGNPNIRKEAVFGEWIVYSYTEDKPFIFAKSKAVLSDGDVSLYSSEFDEDSLILDRNSYKNDPSMFSDINIYPTCLTCLADREAFQVSFSNPRILADSPLYQLKKMSSKIRDKLQINKKQSIESKILQLTGSTLEHAAQINELINQHKNERYIEAVGMDYINTLNALFINVPPILAESQNPYKTVGVLQQYMDAESDYVSDMVSKADEASLISGLESINNEINKIRARLSKFYSKDDFNVKKVYRTYIPSPGEYDLKISSDSIGNLDEVEAPSIKIQIDGGVATPAASISGGNINFAKQYLEKGDHVFALILPSQRNILTAPVVQNVAGRVCYSSMASKFSLEKTYRLSFAANNNSDPSFYFFVDNGVTFSPIISERFESVLKQGKKNIYTISSSTRLKKGSTTLRVAFCALRLNDESYSGNVEHVSLVEITYPRFIIHKAEDNRFGTIPLVSYNKINQTKYMIDIQDAKSPFYFVFAQQFSPGWELSEGEKADDSKFNNVWHIAKTGDFTMELKYAPQEYVHKGFIISAVSLILLCLAFLYTKKRNE